MTKKFNILTIILIIIVCASSLKSDEKIFNWKKISGKWEISKDNNGPYLFEKRGKCRKWNYSEIINHNSIITINSIAEYSSIQLSIEPIGLIDNPANILIIFALKNYRNFFAFKFVNDNQKRNELKFINSKIKDTSLKKSAKNNFVITDLQSMTYDLLYNKKHNIKININKNKATLYIDGKKKMDARANENLAGGQFGFSNRNTQMKIRNIKIYKGNEIVFQDDFSSDTIKRYTAKANRVK